MQDLHELLQQSEQLAITAATGMGGIGKTDLAWHYAEAHRADYPGGIWWISAAQLVVKVLEYSLQMGLDTPPEEFDAAAKVQWCYQKWLGAISEGARLLVWDDVADAEAYGELRDYLPTDARFRLLLTTRAKLGPPVQRLELDVLDLAAALDLLGRLVGNEARLLAEAETARALCEWVGRLPLGIELVGRHLAQHPNLSLAKLLSRLEAQKLSARALQQVAPEMPYRDSLAAAFEISWQSLSEAEQELGGLLSLFALAPIPKVLIGDCLSDWDEEDLEDGLDRALVGSSLLSVLETDEYLLHSLIREFFAAKLQAFSTAEALQRGFAQAMTTVAKTIPPTVTLSDLARTQNRMPHMEAAASYSRWLSDEDCYWPYTGLARLYEGQSLWKQAERWYDGCLKMTEARFGKTHPSTALSLNNLALFYRSQGRYSDAELLFLQALEICRTQLGAEHPNTTISLSNLALLYDSQGRYSEVEPLYLQVLEITRTQLGVEHPSTALSLNNLALLYRSQGRYSEAEPLLLQALEIHRTQLGAEHPDTATSLNNLALLYDSQGRYGDAELLFFQALETRRAQLGVEHPDTATSLNNLALLYRSQGRYGDAEPLLLQALEIRRTQLGAEHPDTASSLNNLAALYESQGRYSEAEPLYLDALSLARVQLGADHPNTASSLNNLALLYYAQGRYSEAEPLLLNALKIRRAHLSADHPDTAGSLNNLAGLYYAQGRYSEAEPLYLDVLGILMEKLGENHPNTQTGWGNFRYLLQRAVEAGRAAELSDHPVTRAVLAQIRTEQAGE